MDDLPLLGLRQFRAQVVTLEEPHRIISTRGGVRRLGTWIPEGHTFVITGTPPVSEVSSEETSDTVSHPERSGKRK